MSHQVFITNVQTETDMEISLLKLHEYLSNLVRDV